MLMPDLEPPRPDVAVVALGDAVQGHSMKLASDLRAHDLAVVHCGGGSAKRQFKLADRENAAYVLVVGEDEMAKGVVTLKQMSTGQQQTLTLDATIELMTATE